MIPPSSPSPANLGLYWTDEQIFACLEKFKEGSALPDDVISDINPYQYNPSYLPDGMWYMSNSTERKENELGFWKARGEACEVYKDSIISGWRTTLEFFEGSAPVGRQTNWLMQEYKITGVEPKHGRTLCRIFLSGGDGPNSDTNGKDKDADIVGGDFSRLVSNFPSTGSTSRRDPRIDTQVKNPESPFDGASEDLLYLNYISSGDYLELNDLADQESRASSSDNSSRYSSISDEFFHSLPLEDTNNDQHKMGSNSKFNVAAFAKPNEVVMELASVGSLASAMASKSPAEKTKPSSATNRNEGASSSHHEASSSNGSKATSKKANVSGITKKLKKKYLCFMPFFI